MSRKKLIRRSRSRIRMASFLFDLNGYEDISQY